MYKMSKHAGFETKTRALISFAEKVLILKYIHVQ